MEQTWTILVVDDDPTVYDAVSSCLSGDDYHIVTASRWTEAIAILQEDRPDVVLLDLHLPTVHGDALLEFIRESDPHLPVVILSSKNNPNDIARLGELGANGFLRKPFETDALLVVIEQIMADLVTVSTAASQLGEFEDSEIRSIAVSTGAAQPDQSEDSEIRSTKNDLPSKISPGAGVYDLKRQPSTSPLDPAKTTAPRKRRTRQKGQGRTRRSTRLRTLRNYVLIMVFFILLSVLLYVMREGLSAGFLGITIN